MYLSMDGLYLLARHREVHPTPVGNHATAPYQGASRSLRSPPTEICFNRLQCHEIRVLLDESLEIVAGHGFVLVPAAAHLNQNTLLRRRGLRVDTHHAHFIFRGRLGDGHG